MNKPELDLFVRELEELQKCLHNKERNLVPYCKIYVPGSDKCNGCDYDLRQKRLERKNDN